MTKAQAIREHIALREQFWELSYSTAERAYAWARCSLHSQKLIENASAGIRRRIAAYGTASAMRKNTEGSQQH